MYVGPSAKASRELSALGVPTTLLIDREGNELGRLLGPAEWDSPEMVGFIRGYIERQSRAAPGGASDEVQLAFDAVPPVAPLGLVGTLPSNGWKGPPVTPKEILR
jgi:hypothetical protein